MQSIYTDVNHLQQEGGHLDLELSAADYDDSDWRLIQLVKLRAIDTSQALHYLLVNGTVFMGNHDDNNVLQTVHTLLDSGIGFYFKIQMVSKAMVIWPDEVFTADSTALTEFIEANHEHLQNVRVQKEAEDSLLDRVMGGVLPQPP